MAFDKAVDSTALNAGLTKIADAIRAKGGTEGTMAFPDGFAELIEAISGGGGKLFDIVANGEIIPSDNIVGEYTIETGFSQFARIGYGAAIFCAEPFEQDDVSRLYNRLVFTMYLPVSMIDNRGKALYINYGYGGTGKVVSDSSQSGRVTSVDNYGEEITLENLNFGTSSSLTLKAGERYKWAMIRPYTEES